MGRVVVVGALSVELVCWVDEAPTFGETVVAVDGPRRWAGGHGGNQAVAARAAGSEVVMVGSVGDDDLGRAYTELLQRNDIETRLRVVHDESTGLTVVLRPGGGDAARVVLPGATQRAGDLLGDLCPIAPSDVVLLQSELPAATLLAAAVRTDVSGARLVVSCAPYTGLPHEVVARADPLVVNERGARALGESGQLPRSLVVTFGPAGSTWDEESAYAPVLAHDEGAPSFEAGAGDVFCGALAAALADGADRHTALTRANRAAAESTAWYGAQRHGEL